MNIYIYFASFGSRWYSIMNKCMPLLILKVSFGIHQSFAPLLGISSWGTHDSHSLEWFFFLHRILIVTFWLLRLGGWQPRTFRIRLIIHLSCLHIFREKNSQNTTWGKCHHIQQSMHTKLTQLNLRQKSALPQSAIQALHVKVLEWLKQKSPEH